MKIILSPEEFLELKVLYKNEKNKKRAERINIILLLHKGYTQIEVADILNLDEDSITKWKKYFLERKDMISWSETHYTQYFSKLSFHEISQLRCYINTFLVPRKKELNSYLSDSLGISYTPSGLNKLLKRINFSYQTIHKLPGKCPVEKQEKWIKDFAETLQNMQSADILLFMDSVHPAHNTTYSKLWAEKGKPRWISSNTGREHLNISGLYEPNNQEVTIQKDSTINSKTTIELLKKCNERYQDKQNIIIYLDNASYHKSKEVKEYLASQSKIKLSFLPPYSPNLNLIERLWKFTNEKIINLKYFPTFKEFENRVTSFFENIEIYKEELKTRINFKFQIFPNNVMLV